MESFKNPKESPEKEDTRQRLLSDMAKTANLDRVIKRLSVEADKEKPALSESEKSTLLKMERATLEGNVSVMQKLAISFGNQPKEAERLCAIMSRHLKPIGVACRWEMDKEFHPPVGFIHVMGDYHYRSIEFDFSANPARKRTEAYTVFPYPYFDPPYNPTREQRKERGHRLMPEFAKMAHKAAEKLEQWQDKHKKTASA